MSNFKYCAIIPTLNHYKVLENVVQDVLNHGLDVVIIDDGSAADIAPHIQALENKAKGVFVLRHETNMGKGKALETGFLWAHDHGYSHALQVDADGQHDRNDIQSLIEKSRAHPNDLVTAVPIYDDSIPLGRKIGRRITHFWVWIETLSFSISDSMCGFRIYPLPQTLEVIEQKSIGSRMDFDTSIMVHLYWKGCSVIEAPSKVIYPEGNSSNFRMLQDNILISRMHTRLVCEMLWRLLRFKKRGQN